MSPTLLDRSCHPPRLLFPPQCHYFYFARLSDDLWWCLDHCFVHVSAHPFSACSPLCICTRSAVPCACIESVSGSCFPYCVIRETITSRHIGRRSQHNKDLFTQQHTKTQRAGEKHNQPKSSNVNKKFCTRHYFLLTPLSLWQWGLFRWRVGTQQLSPPLWVLLRILCKFSIDLSDSYIPHWLLIGTTAARCLHCPWEFSDTFLS